MAHLTLCLSSIRSISAALMLAFWMAPGIAATLPSDIKPADRQSSQRAIPEHMFRCTEDAQCTVVQGWCITFAINKAYQTAYDAIPNDPNGKGARNCPPGWLPPLPKAVCETQRCKVMSGRPEQ